MHADLMMDLLRSKKLLKYGKQPGAFLYVPHKALDKHITENIDTFFGFNHIEIFGKVWGLHYLYEFLFENGMIDQKHYDKMLATLSFLKRDFLTMLGSNAWKGKFVLSWPKSKANKLDLNPGFFDTVSTTQELRFGEFLRLITEGDYDQDGTIDIWDDDAVLLDELIKTANPTVGVETHGCASPEGHASLRVVKPTIDGNPAPRVVNPFADVSDKQRTKNRSPFTVFRYI